MGTQVLLRNQQDPSRNGVYDVERDNDGNLYYKPVMPVKYITLKSVINSDRSETFAEFMYKSFEQNTKKKITEVFDYSGVKTGRFNSDQENKGPLPSSHPYYNPPKPPTNIFHAEREKYYQHVNGTITPLCSNRSWSEMEWIDAEFERFLSSMQADCRTIYQTAIVKPLEENRVKNIDLYYAAKINLMKLDISSLQRHGFKFVYREFPLDYLPVD